MKKRLVAMAFDCFERAIAAHGTAATGDPLTPRAEDSGDICGDYLMKWWMALSPIRPTKMR
jgi:hypothetical protein